MASERAPNIGVLRLYCEMIPVSRLLHEDMRAFFTGFRRALAEAPEPWCGDIEIVLKVTLPEDGGPSPDLLNALSRRDDLDVDRIWLWGQLADRRRVYLNTHTHGAVFDGWGRLLDALDAVDIEVEGLFFDIEPELDLLERLAKLDPRSLWDMARRYAGRGYRGEVEAVGRSIEALRARTQAPMLAACFSTGWMGPLGRLVERAMGAPLGNVGGLGPLWPELTAMNYMSFLLPVLGGPTPAALWLTSRLGGAVARAHTRQARRRGVRGSVICGTCGIGVLGDEPCYPTPTSMASLLEQVARSEPYALEIFNLLGVVHSGQSYREGLKINEARWRGWASVLSGVLGGGG